MISIKLESNSGELDRMFIRVSDSFKDLTVPLKRTGVYLLSSIDKNFEMQGRPRRWTPLSPMTISMRRGSSSKILQDTGYLRRSIAYKLLGKTELRVGTNVAYGRLHQFGGVTRIPAHTERVKKHTRKVKGRSVVVKGFSRKVKTRTFKVPARPFLLTQKEDIKAIEIIFDQWLKKIIQDNIRRIR